MNKTKSLKRLQNVSLVRRGLSFLLAIQSGYGQVKQQSHTAVLSQLGLSCIHNLVLQQQMWQLCFLGLHADVMTLQALVSQRAAS